MPADHQADLLACEVRSSKRHKRSYDDAIVRDHTLKQYAQLQIEVTMDSGPDNSYSLSGDQIHDLKNRLTVIRGIAQLIGRQVERADWERDKIMDRVDRLDREIDHIELLLNSYQQHALRAEPLSDEGDSLIP